MTKITITIDTDKHVVLPREPTREMLIAARSVHDLSDIIIAPYKAMIRTAPPPPSAWQPIESAPRDGTLLLCYGPGNKKALIQRARTVQFRMDFVRKESVGKHRFYNEFPEAPYTHWMPLPKPPEGV